MDIYNTYNTHNKLTGIYIFTWILFIVLIYLEFGIVASYISTLLIFMILTVFFCYDDNIINNPPPGTNEP